MPRKAFSIKFRPEKLKELIDKGLTARQIMKELGISRFTLKEHLLLLEQQEKKVYLVPGLLEEEEQRKRIVKFRRGRIFSPSALAESDFKPGDAFEMEEREGKTILRKLS